MNTGRKRKVWEEVRKNKLRWFIAFKGGSFCDMFEYFGLDESHVIKTKLQSREVLGFFKFVYEVKGLAGFIRASGDEFFVLAETKEDILRYIRNIPHPKIISREFEKKEVEKKIIECDWKLFID